jgi:hypothetical protein
VHDRDEKLYKIFVGKSERKRLLYRPRQRWENNICVTNISMCEDVGCSGGLF